LKPTAPAGRAAKLSRSSAKAGGGSRFRARRDARPSLGDAGCTTQKQNSRTEKSTGYTRSHNATLPSLLQNVTAHIPLKRLVAITGVSGSGKSTLARDVLLANVQTAVQKRSSKAGRDALAAGEKIELDRLRWRQRF